MKNKWWFFGLRAALGIVFIIASISKLTAQSQFINEVAGYGLLTPTMARLYGLALPWAELVAGVSLIFGMFSRPALILSLLMTFSFTVANIFAMYQGNLEDCGCFGQLIPLSHTASLIVDSLVMLIAGFLLFFRNKIPIIGISGLLSKLSFTGSKILEYSMKNVSEFVLLAAVVLATGLPLSLGNTISPIYNELDSSLAQNKPVFLYFYLEGCGECEKQKEIIDELEQKYYRAIGFIGVDFEEEASVAVDFEVTRVPAIVIINSKTDTDYQVLQLFTTLTSEDVLQRALYDQLGAYICSEFKPIAEFAASPLSGDVPVEVKFTDSSLGDIQSWAWDFDNDGNIDSNIQHPTHVFREPGNYSVSLTVNGHCGPSTTIKERYLQLIFTGCEADFIAETTEIDGPSLIKFFDKSKGDIVSWEWDFDNDGIIDSTDRNPLHTYDENGEYTVTLTVKTADCDDTTTKKNYIRVTGCRG